MGAFKQKPLTEGELELLRDLLSRYVLYHAAGAANTAIDYIAAKWFKSNPPTIDATPSPVPAKR